MIRKALLVLALLSPVVLDMGTQWGGWPMPTCFPCDSRGGK